MINYKMVFVLMLVNVSQVNAIVLNGNVAGQFSEEAGKASLEWGTPQFPVPIGKKSSLSYEGIDNFTTEGGERFKIATLIYSNTRITQSSSYDLSVSNKSLDLLVDFTSPIEISGFSFNYDLMITETDNSSGDTDDRVRLIPANDFNASFSLNNQDFIFELIGFDNGSGGFENSFTQSEDTISSVDLYAKITAVPIPSALWLFMTALSGFIITGNRKRK